MLHSLVSINVQVKEVEFRIIKEYLNLFLLTVSREPTVEEKIMRSTLIFKHFSFREVTMYLLSSITEIFQ